MQLDPIFECVCSELRSGEKVLITHLVRPFYLHPINVQRFFDKAKKFPKIYGRDIEGESDKFVNLFLSEVNGMYAPNGLFWEINNKDNPTELEGMFYLTDIGVSDAYAHFVFFDLRTNGREILVRKMLDHFFDRYPTLNRLSAIVPLYSAKIVLHFATKCGFNVEGKKEDAFLFQEKWFSALMYGITRKKLKSLIKADIRDGIK